jgi:CNT family concentrative nucleoside transporter
LSERFGTFTSQIVSVRFPLASRNGRDASAEEKRMGRFTGVLGIVAILGLAYVFSTSRRSIRLKTIAWGLGLQLALGLFVLRVPSGQWLFQKLGNGAKKLLDFSYVGSTFVFGELGKPIPR